MLAERPDLEARSRWLLSTFPEFMHHDAVVDRYWYALFADFAGVQIAVCDDGSGVLAAGHCIPVFGTVPSEICKRGWTGCWNGERKVSDGGALRRWFRRCWRWCRPCTGGAGSAAWFWAR